MLEFMQPFDGTQPELSENEKREAAMLFVKIVDALYERWPTRAVLLEPDDEGLTIRQGLQLYDRWGLNAILFGAYRSMNLGTGELTSHFLELRCLRYGSSRYKRHALDCVSDITHSYYAENDAVTRLDERERVGDFIVLPPTSPGVTRGQQFLRFMFTDFMESWANEQLAADMGYSDQPVGVAEMEALFAASMFATPTRDSIDSSTGVRGVKR